MQIRIFFLFFVDYKPEPDFVGASIRTFFFDFGRIYPTAYYWNFTFFPDESPPTFLKSVFFKLLLLPSSPCYRISSFYVLWL
jgi:hypothetical protein